MDADRPVWDPPSARGRGRLPERTSIVIVGGGITGVALLRELPNAVLLEAAHLAAGASGRNAGFLLAGVASNYAEVGAGRVRLQLDSGDDVVAEAVVLATNGFTSTLAPSLPIEPVRAQMCATVPTSVALVYRPAYADHGYQYWRQRADGRVLVGGY